MYFFYQVNVTKTYSLLLSTQINFLQLPLEIPIKIYIFLNIRMKT